MPKKVTERQYILRVVRHLSSLLWSESDESPRTSDSCRCTSRQDFVGGEGERLCWQMSQSSEDCLHASSTNTTRDLQSSLHFELTARCSLLWWLQRSKAVQSRQGRGKSLFGRVIKTKQDCCFTLSLRQHQTPQQSCEKAQNYVCEFLVSVCSFQSQLCRITIRNWKTRSRLFCVKRNVPFWICAKLLPQSCQTIDSHCFMSRSGKIAPLGANFWVHGSKTFWIPGAILEALP